MDAYSRRINKSPDRCNTDDSENARNIKMEIDKDNANLTHTALACTSDTIIKSD